MSSRHVHVVQPYWVGTKDKKSLAVIIPAQIIKERNLDASTMFGRLETTKILLQVINPEPTNKETVIILTGESLETASQQVSSSRVQ